MNIYKIGQDFDNYKFFVFKENDELNKDIWDFKGQSLIKGWKGLIQFVRNGFFCVDAKDSKEDALVFNRIVSLKSSFKLPAAK